MEAFAWLVLTILPILLLVSLSFFLLGRRSACGIPSAVLADKEGIILREQSRMDETVRKLDAAEEQLKELRVNYGKLQTEYENLMHTTVSRRRLSQAESIIYGLHREKNHLLTELGSATVPMPEFNSETPPPQTKPANSSPLQEPTPETSPAPVPRIVPNPEPETAPEPTTEAIPDELTEPASSEVPLEPVNMISETEKPTDIIPPEPSTVHAPKKRIKKNRR